MSAEPNVVLRRHGRAIASVFDLLGTDENDLTAALGFTLARCPVLLAEFTELLMPGAVGPVTVQMETSDERGRSDLELVAADAHLAVVEAKKGWLLPDENMLRDRGYARRVLKAGAGSLVTLSEASPRWARQALPATVDGVPVRHLPWSEVRGLLATAARQCRGAQRHWLDELDTYLRKAVKVRDISDCWTYCVAISNDRPGDGGARTFRDFVDEGWYFHPFGGAGGWPKSPPNFMAFRWSNAVQRIHRVISADVVQLRDRWPDIPETPDTLRPHALYRLGPALPGTPIPSGFNYRANRMLVLLDPLLVGPTLRDAVAASTEAPQ